LPGEPDLDRIIRFRPQDAAWRWGCPPIGVHVTDVYENGLRIDNHALAGADVELLHEPRFLGENGIIVQWSEPIVPFHICIRKGELRLSRPHADAESFPFEGDLRGKEPNYCPGEIGEATGIWDAEAAWTVRMEKLQCKCDESSDDTERAALRARIEMFRSAMKGMAFSFWAKVPYFIPLNGRADIKDPKKQLTIDSEACWAADFWMGGWDTDALSGFVCGFVTIPFAPPGMAKDETVRKQRGVSRIRRQIGHL
jgi:hypothetical protein